jgi:hypothetical protein
VKEAYRIGESIFDKHSPGITQDELSRGGFSVVGQQDGWYVVAEILDEELAESAFQ